MSSYYGVLFPEYFDGPTGREIQRLGGKDALLLGAFLVGNRRANMIGLYRLPLDEITTAIKGLKRPQLIRAIGALVGADFIDYDFGTEFVWVHEMARIRLNLPNRAAPLKPDDNRLGFIHSLYQRLEENPFLERFFDRYQKQLRLKGKRTSNLPHKIEPLESPSEAPPKPVQRSDRTSTGDPESTYVGGSTEVFSDQDQGSGSGKAPARARRNAHPVENAEGTFGLYCVIAAEALKTSTDQDHDDSVSNVAEHFKTLCARRHLAYNGDLAARAIEACVAAAHKALA